MPDFKWNIIKILSVAALVLGAFAVPWGVGSPVRAQISGSSTGWCSDYEGNNFPCSDGGSSGGGGGRGYGGGCATQAMQDAQIGAQNARSFVTMGNQLWDQGDYIGAADSYMFAVDSDPSSVRAHHNLAAALGHVGFEASDRGDAMSAYLYHERAYDHWPEDANVQNNLEDARYSAPSKSCSTCGEAIMSDIAYGLGASASIYAYVHQATANYDNCTRALTCNDTDGSSFRYLARKSCYQTFIDSESGFRTCLQTALEDRGWSFW